MSDNLTSYEEAMVQAIYEAGQRYATELGAGTFKSAIKRCVLALRFDAQAERAAIVADLRRQVERRRAWCDREDELQGGPTQMTRDIRDVATVLKNTADAIERGDHLTPGGAPPPKEKP